MIERRLVLGCRHEEAPSSPESLSTGFDLQEQELGRALGVGGAEGGEDPGRAGTGLNLASGRLLVPGCTASTMTCSFPTSPMPDPVASESSSMT
ncbi:hypothetical protein [Streptomyces sp. NPDC002209]|uniref:hypothetical protein n=1 Tax=Streptomyces sp. NPDC002209 TaxID=3364638 RepID=UPI0036A81595